MDCGNEWLDIVEVSAPSKAKEGTPKSSRAEDVGELVTLRSVGCSGQIVLRREQCDI
jgi:hypothetical protein